MEITISQTNNERAKTSKTSADKTKAAARPADRQRTNASRPTADGKRPASGTKRPASSRPAGEGKSTASAQNKKKTAQNATAAQMAAASQRNAAAQRPASKQTKKKKKGISPLLIVLIVALVLAIVIFAGIGIYAMQYVNYDKIMPNVYVAGIDVGGMTKEEAAAIISETLSQTEQKSVNVNLPDQVLTFTPEQGTVLIDADVAVEEAFAYGRASTNPFSISRAIKAAQRTRNDIDISTAVQVDTAYIRTLIDDTAASVKANMVESEVIPDEEAHTITVTIGSPGRELDADKLYELVAGAFSSGDYSDIDFEYKMTYPANVDLGELYDQMTTDPEDAYYDAESGSVVPEINGFVPAVTLEEANEQLALASAGETLTFNFDATPAEITAEILEPLLFRDTLSSYGSWYENNAGRTTNLKLACQAINGTILQPGDTFSFNDIVGERTAEKGYKEGIVYVDGQSEPEVGGGVCQVASTIYYCVLYADLEVVHREPHMYTVSYVPGGMDATVYWGYVDFQFKNNTDFPIRIDASIKNGKCNISLVGTNLYQRYCELTYKKTASKPYSTQTVTGVGVNVSGYNGATYEITRTVYNYDGSVFRYDDTAALNAMGNLGTSNYAKRDAVIYVPEESPSPSPSEEPSASPSVSPSTSPNAPTPTPETPTPTPEAPTPTPEAPTPTPAPATPTPAPTTPAPADPPPADPAA